MNEPSAGGCRRSPSETAETVFARQAEVWLTTPQAKGSAQLANGRRAVEQTDGRPDHRRWSGRTGAPVPSHGHRRGSHTGARDVSSVWLWVRSEWRRRGGSLVGLALLIGIAGGTTLAAWAGARRTASSFDRRLDQEQGSNIDVLSFPPLSGPGSEVLDQVSGNSRCHGRDLDGLRVRTTRRRRPRIFLDSPHR